MVEKIRWSPRAVSQIEEICEYIAKDSEFYASLFAKRIMVIIRELPKFPRSGRIVPEYQDEKLREKIYQNYRIVYKLKEDMVEIVAIVHSARQFKEIVK